MTKNGFIAELESRSQVYQRKVEELRVALVKYEALLDSCHALLQAEREAERASLPTRSLFEHGQQASLPGVPVGMPGNRSPDMPPRFPEFATSSLYEAIDRVLSQASEGLHANDITRRIYQVVAGKQLYKAKHTLTSYLLRGKAEGRYERIGPNRYRKPKNGTGGASD